MRQRVVVIRHGETEWSRSGRHTGTTDLPLTERGRDAARRLAPLLARFSFGLVLSSPLRRARETCELAGLGARAALDDDLVEWNYGDYEGLTTPQIRERVPGWRVFSHGCPGGEVAAGVGARADRVIGRIRAAEEDVAVFAHGHVLRVLAARWLGLAPERGEGLMLGTATLNLLGYEHECPALRVWNAPLPPPGWDPGDA
jgi:broad specificity phosphatase PhoE